jgi:hypothetical protein
MLVGHSKWGNPFVIGNDGTREQVIAKYEAWLQTQCHCSLPFQNAKAKSSVVGAALYRAMATYYSDWPIVEWRLRSLE